MARKRVAGLAPPNRADVITRRVLMNSALAFAALSTLAGCGRREGATDGIAAERDAVVNLLEALFPHQDLDRSVYAQVAAIVHEQLEARPDWPSLSIEGAAALAPLEAPNWRRMKASVRREAVEAITGTSFFKAVYQASMTEFYSHSEVWALIGYPGASVQKGGYINRGFDDIDWLPKLAVP